MKSHHPARLDGNGFTGARVSARSRRLGPDLEVAKTRKLDVLAVHQALRNQVKESVDHVLGLALVQPDLIEQEVGQLRLGQRRGFDACYRKLNRVGAPGFSSNTQPTTGAGDQLGHDGLHGRVDLGFCQGGLGPAQ